MRADEIEIEAPCEQDWDRMRPEAGGRRRWCDHCEQQVHDLSQMSEPAARAFVRANPGKACVAYFEDGSGELVFAATPAPASLIPLERVARRPLASAASFAVLLAACTPHGDDNQAIRLDDAEPTQVVAPMSVTVIPTVTADSPETVAVPAVEPCDPPAIPPEARPIKGALRKQPKKMGIIWAAPDGDPLGGL